MRGALIEFGLGAVLATSASYAVLFAPLVPQGVMMVIFFGLGILPLSPLLALFTILLVMARIGPSWSMVMGALVCLLLNQLSSYRADSTRYWAVQGEVVKLRRWGDMKVLLSDCHSHQRAWNAPSNERAREMYWRATGENALAETKRRPLELTSSRMDGSVDPDGAVAYLEWTAEVHNPGRNQEEGDFLLALPPDTVASRATLWIDGSEREAAFASTGQVQAAYKSVVERRMDPLLVTSAGAGRLRVLCFPVPPQGKMKFRIGFSSHLSLRRPEQALLEFPHLISDNLQQRASTFLWVESTRELTCEGKRPARVVSGEWAQCPPMLARRDPACSSVCCRLKEGGWLRAHLRQHAPPERMALVIDGSRAMAAHEVEARVALLSLPKALHLLAADEGPREIVGERLDFVGGQDNVPALEQALQRADTVVWLHGPQMMAPARSDHLKQILERGQGRILEVTLTEGDDSLVPLLDVPNLQPLSRGPELGESLKLQDQWDWEYQRSAQRPEGHETSGHLARLWAAQSGSLDQAVQYQVVTPRTGAVVLENAQQYQENRLQPVAPGSVPTIPEPGTLALLGVAGAALSWRRRR